MALPLNIILRPNEYGIINRPYQVTEFPIVYYKYQKIQQHKYIKDIYETTLYGVYCNTWQKVLEFCGTRAKKLTLTIQHYKSNNLAVITNINEIKVVFFYTEDENEVKKHMIETFNLDVSEYVITNWGDTLTLEGNYVVVEK